MQLRKKILPAQCGSEHVRTVKRCPVVFISCRSCARTKGRQKFYFISPTFLRSRFTFFFVSRRSMRRRERDGSHEYRIITTAPSGGPRRGAASSSSSSYSSSYSYSYSFIADACMRISLLPSSAPLPPYRFTFTFSLVVVPSDSTYRFKNQARPLRFSPCKLQ